MRLAAILLFGISLCGSALGAAKSDSTRASVTYVAGDAVYLSVGRDAGIADSTLCYVLDRKDTVAVLKVLATSSKSSVCAVVRSKRPVAVGDQVRFTFSADEIAAAPVPQTKDSAAIAPQAAAAWKSRAAEPGAVSLHGRLNAQYFMTKQSGGASTLARPGVVLSLKGTARDVPVSFDLYGNFRSLSYGGSLFGKGSVNQNRIYTLSLQYDDGLTRVAAGRISQALIGSAGYIDGVLISRRLDHFTLGVSGGYEPLFSQRSFGSDYRKFSLFGNYSVDGDVPASATVAYTRSFYHSALERDVASASATASPSGDLMLMAQGDVDLHTKRGSALIPHASLSNLYSSMRYRISPILSVGVGLSAWRPTYAFSAVSEIPDSMLDHALRTSPNANFSLLLPSGMSLYDTYSTRSSDGGFGKEFSNFTSLNVSNLFGQGLSARGSVSFNTTAFARMRGLGGSLQKSFLGVADATVRYQWYKYSYTNWGGVTTSKTAGFDLMLSAVRAVTFWGSIERMMSTDLNTTSVFLDVAWRF